MSVLMRFFICLMLSGTGSMLVAAPTDIAIAPLGYLLSAQVKPNLMFILDDSGSMQWSYLGDEVVKHGYENAVGYRSSLCNKIYYDPQVDYALPVRADGTLFPAQEWTGARYDGFRADSPVIDLSSGFMAWRSSVSVPSMPSTTSGSLLQPDCSAAVACSPSNNGLPNLPAAGYYFIYQGNQRDNLGSNAADDPCKDIKFDKDRGGSGPWVKVLVSSTSGPGNRDERQNFAIWFSYHRTRILAMKTAAGRAFNDIDENFRVGFSTISESGTDSDQPGFLKISAFDAVHKARFYAKLYATVPLSSTPLRAALAKAGQLYAGKLLTGADDPVQYSCQRNFSLLATDGYWNTGMETASYGPKKIDGRTDVGNQDNALPRPMYDGSGSAPGSSPPIYVVRLTVPTVRTPGFGWSVVNNISVNGQNLMSRLIGIDHSANLNLDATTFATRIADAITLGGFSATASGTEILIVAPASAGPLSGPPVLDQAGALPISIGSFEPIPAAQRTISTLADVAAYYYQTDLRNAALGNCRSNPEVCTNNAPASDLGDEARHQRMVSYTLGLGASGLLHYQENYEQATTGDFYDIKTGNRNWPDPIYLNGPERIDDLWHAAVNGGGTYFNARNSQELARSLTLTMRAIRASVGSAAAAATSTQEPVAGDNMIFLSRYRTVNWDGELKAQRIDVANGVLLPTVLWSAQALLDQQSEARVDRRTIFTYAPDRSNRLKPFLWSALTVDEKAHFSEMCNPPFKLSQCNQLSSPQRSLASGALLVNFLRGHTGDEDRPENINPLFRRREHVLGALINAQPLFVARPAFRYVDDNYGAFRDEQAKDRSSMVYAAANDGMLHAFDAATGSEQWAFIPPAVLPSLYRWADPNLDNRFRYLLDGSPIAGDICPTAPTSTCDKTAWRTILVGGLAGGGRQYYALDITDPAAPKALWVFGTAQDQDMGFAFGKPIITKRRNGRWVVVFASGYNNIGPGDGKGYLYVLDAFTGEHLEKISTGAGSVASPSGLAQLNGWVDSVGDNTASRFYGGDLLGNVWRFDPDDLVPPAGKEAVQLVSLRYDQQSQPVSTRPELSEILVGNQRVPVVSVVTGQYLGLADAADRSVQSLYTFKDTLDAQGLGVVQARSDIVTQTLTLNRAGTQQSVTQEPVNWLQKSGWVVHFTGAQHADGERGTVDPEQQLGILRVLTNTPGNSVCAAGGASWIYAFDFRSGTYFPLATDRVVGKKIADNALVVGALSIKIGERTYAVVTDETGNINFVEDPLPAGGTRTVKRVAWRELDEQ